MDVGVINPGGDGISSKLPSVSRYMFCNSPSSTVRSSMPTVAADFAARLCFLITRQTVTKQQSTATVPIAKETYIGCDMITWMVFIKVFDGSVGCSVGEDVGDIVGIFVGYSDDVGKVVGVLVGDSEGI